MHRGESYMNIVRSISRRTFLWLFIYTLLLAGLITGGVYAGAVYIFSAVPLESLKAAVLENPELEEGVQQVWPLVEQYHELFIPAFIAVFVIFFLLCWLTVRGIVIRALRRGGISIHRETAEGGKKKPEAETKKKSRREIVGEPDFGDDGDAKAISRKDAQEKNRRYYLHVLSVLQREGRLVDFLQEDLSLYDDGQIGAAVRSIHDNCKKCLLKNLSPQPVMEEAEGDTVSVPPDFDPAAIKLTGNVTGEPPFKGVLRHRGWRAAILELPVITGTGDPKIIAPAEVEIQ